MLDTCVGMDRERELKDNDEAPEVEVEVVEVREVAVVGVVGVVVVGVVSWHLHLWSV